MRDGRDPSRGLTSDIRETWQFQIASNRAKGFSKFYSRCLIAPLLTHAEDASEQDKPIGTAEYTMAYLGGIYVPYATGRGGSMAEMKGAASVREGIVTRWSRPAVSERGVWAWLLPL